VRVAARKALPICALLVVAGVRLPARRPDAVALRVPGVWLRCKCSCSRSFSGKLDLRLWLTWPQSANSCSSPRGNAGTDRRQLQEQEEERERWRELSTAPCACWWTLGALHCALYLPASLSFAHTTAICLEPHPCPHQRPCQSRIPCPMFRSGPFTSSYHSICLSSPRVYPKGCPRPGPSWSIGFPKPLACCVHVSCDAIRHHHPHCVCAVGYDCELASYAPAPTAFAVVKSKMEGGEGAVSSAADEAVPRGVPLRKGSLCEPDTPRSSTSLAAGVAGSEAVGASSGVVLSDGSQGLWGGKGLAAAGDARPGVPHSVSPSNQGATGGGGVGVSGAAWATAAAVAFVPSQPRLPPDVAKYVSAAPFVPRQPPAAPSMGPRPLPAPARPTWTPAAPQPPAMPVPFVEGGVPAGPVGRARYLKEGKDPRLAGAVATGFSYVFGTPADVACTASGGGAATGPSTGDVKIDVEVPAVFEHRIQRCVQGVLEEGKAKRVAFVGSDAALGLCRVSVAGSLEEVAYVRARIEQVRCGAGVPVWRPCVGTSATP
jgi:hypothetical protein